MRIDKICARQVLDSRGRYTIEVDVFSKKMYGRAIVPSGASTGEHEALELRDKNGTVLPAIRNVNKILSRKLRGYNVFDQKSIDERMIELDGSENKSNLGANAILGVSLACANLGAKLKKKPLYSYLGNGKVLPVPYVNVINGGRHASGKLKIQEFMLVPNKAKSFSKAVTQITEVYHILKKRINKKYGTSAVGDEGGFVPPLKSAKKVLDLLDKAIDESGYKMGIALDCAASEYYRKGKYYLEKKYSSSDLFNYYEELINTYNIVSIEDPFDEDDLMAWKLFTNEVNIQVVADDLTVSNLSRLNLATLNKLANTLLLKLNQVGTLTESLNAYKFAKKHKWGVMVSHRSGETEDTFIADLSVALNSGMIKIGAPARGERTAKYNRLLRIEEELGKRGKYGKP